MAEPNRNQPPEPERYETETETEESSTSSGGDGQDVGPPDNQETPVVHVEPPLTQAQPPFFIFPFHHQGSLLHYH